MKESKINMTEKEIIDLLDNLGYKYNRETDCFYARGGTVEIYIPKKDRSNLTIVLDHIFSKERDIVYEEAFQNFTSDLCNYLKSLK